VKPTPREPVRHPVFSCRVLDSLEELEARLETQWIAPAASLDDDTCLYYLCTSRCSTTKCTAFLVP